MGGCSIFAKWRNWTVVCILLLVFRRRKPLSWFGIESICQQFAFRFLPLLKLILHSFLSSSPTYMLLVRLLVNIFWLSAWFAVACAPWYQPDFVFHEEQSMFFHVKLTKLKRSDVIGAARGELRKGQHRLFFLNISHPESYRLIMFVYIVVTRCCFLPPVSWVHKPHH